MKTVTLQELEDDFDAIIEDVENNKQHYLIKYEGGDAMLIPYESYEVLADTYKDWVEKT